MGSVASPVTLIGQFFHQFCCMPYVYGMQLSHSLKLDVAVSVSVCRCRGGKSRDRFLNTTNTKLYRDHLRVLQLEVSILYQNHSQREIT